jgi:hypothetical protein
MPVTIKQEPPKPEDVRYTLSGLTGEQISRIFWALYEKYPKGHPGDSDLMQALWNGE